MKFNDLWKKTTEIEIEKAQIKYAERLEQIITISKCTSSISANTFSLRKLN
jgi:hypothetical protein